MATAPRVTAYPYPRISPRSATFKVKAAGQEIFVYRTSCGDFAAFACDAHPEGIQVEIETAGPAKSVRVAPARHGITPAIQGNRICLQLPRPTHLLIEIDGLPQLYLYADAPEANPPSPDDPNVRYFRAGQVHEVGELHLSSNQTLYIEGGAVLRGCIRATSATNVRIAGRGILDGSYYQQGVDGRRSIILEDCHNSRIDDIIMVEPSSWMLVLGACQNVTVHNIKQLGEVSSSDGIDIVGSRQIRVENCFCRNGDDCIAIKSLDLRPHGGATLDYALDVEDVEVRGCSFLSYRGGQALEIGHELRTASIRDIRFVDCDILAGEPVRGSLQHPQRRPRHRQRCPL